MATDARRREALRRVREPAGVSRALRRPAHRLPRHPAPVQGMREGLALLRWRHEKERGKAGYPARDHQQGATDGLREAGAAPVV